MRVIREPSMSCAEIRARLSAVGFVALEHALDDDLFRRLQEEAGRQRLAAVRADGNDEVPYRAHIADLGAVAREFLVNEGIAGLLAEAFGERLVLSEDASCYTYYGEGDRLGLHQDRPQACAATIILYLAVQGVSAGHPESGLSLRVFGETRPQPGTPPAAIVPSRTGTLVLGWGAKVWHERPRLCGGEAVAALTSCYRRAAA